MFTQLHQTNNKKERKMPLTNSTTSKVRCHSSPSIREMNHRDILFKKKLESIRDYVTLLEDDPEEAKKAETQWQKHFYKDQLKVAISINFSLVKLVEEKEREISDLINQLGQLKKKTQQSFQIDKELTCFPNENNQMQSNRKSSTPKKYKEKALEAQKKILGAKISQEKEQFKKIMSRQEDLLKSNKEENYFLRDQLLKMGEKITLLQQKNYRLMIQNAELRKKPTLSAEKQSEEKNIGRVLNFSPIQMRLSDDQIDFDIISFKNLETSSRNDEGNPFQDEIKRLDQIIESQSGQKEKDIQKETSDCKIKNYQEMEKDYLSLKKEMTEVLIELEKHKNMVSSLKQRNAIDLQKVERQTKCSECQKFKLLNKDIFTQLQNASQKIKTLQQKMARMVSLSQNYQQDLQTLFLETESNPKK